MKALLPAEALAKCPDRIDFSADACIERGNAFAFRAVALTSAFDTRAKSAMIQVIREFSRNFRERFTSFRKMSQLSALQTVQNDSERSQTAKNSAKTMRNGAKTVQNDVTTALGWPPRAS